MNFTICKNSLKPNGILLFASFKSQALFDMLWTVLFSHKKGICAMPDEKVASLLLVKELLEAGKTKAVVDQSFPLERIAEAYRYVEAGLKEGDVTKLV